MYLITLTIFGVLELSIGLPLENSQDQNSRIVNNETEAFAIPNDGSQVQNLYNPQDFYQAPRIIRSMEESSNPEDFGQMDTGLSHEESLRTLEQGLRIVGGEYASEDEARHMVGLIFGEYLKVFLCGGSLISQKTVLTAAHCIDEVVWFGQLQKSLRGQIGSVYISKGYTAIKFSGFEKHPDWDKAEIKNDIGVLKMVEPVNDSRVRIIKLDFKWLGGGKKVTIAGWGSLQHLGSNPDRLQLLDVYTLSSKECEEGVNEANLQNRSSPPVDSSVEVCTMHRNGAGQGMCHGDSGSAVMSNPELREDISIMGIVSWGFPCALGHPDVHTRLSAYESWLRPILEADGVVI
ncbi:chymotrypsin-1-like [Leguminivora glycinivorella]|uniref:chymotrypsin-1-like n=1 Tax=Leguminivora glycinivorella TaxID=1035111 RepID=UPI00200F0D5E|nr:chymotrypsin-1-like [Leguminivora glycinivorella]